ncbi:dual specificity protein phosphatase family protein [Falsirhodobacter deserti]|uniref:dual specificity protein phosphatase family protein n=1 Tax=Falsirhodobacter deserti TaxID=1365611 RepID=UPI0019D4BD51|nr:dual specificity protein phosphatase [Falsirhodobacter deserti]
MADALTLEQMTAQRPWISLIERDLPGSGVDLFIGDKQAASDPALLARHNITAVLNCAVNLDINVVQPPAPEAGNIAFGPGFVRYYKLGIVDGPGNPAPMMLAGYYQLAGLLAQDLPVKPSYPLREKGNVLVHCRGGRSRSATLVALFLHLERPDRYATLDAAVDHVRHARMLHPDEWFEAPKPVLVDAARWAANMARMIQPHLP